ncbi:hypothetical protein HDU97_002656 [Phlyctochytrium planicorne]|nr:hypothetical protein HDU97_002656 [Phlyctochytrium planicorne]
MFGRVRAALTHADAPKYYWAEGLLMANHAENRQKSHSIPLKPLSKTSSSAALTRTPTKSPTKLSSAASLATAITMRIPFSTPAGKSAPKKVVGKPSSSGETPFSRRKNSTSGQPPTRRNLHSPNGQNSRNTPWRSICQRTHPTNTTSHPTTLNPDQYPRTSLYIPTPSYTYAFTLSNI